MRRIIVCIICPWFDPYRIPLLKRISCHFDVYVIYTMPREQGREWCIPEELPINAIYLKSRLILKTKFRKMFGEKRSIYYPSGLVSTIRKINPDVVIGLEFRISSIIGCIWTIIKGRKYITWSDMTSHYDMHMDSLRITVRRFILFFSHALIGSSSDTIKHFTDDLNFSKDKIFLSILSAHIQERITIDTNRSYRENDEVNFIYVGEILKRKGVHLLIQAFSILSKKYKNISLTIIGKGNDHKFMEDMVETLDCKDSVVFTGSVNYEEVPKRMICYDVFVFPTLIDAFGLVIAEAAACGLPVICSRYAGSANDLVRNNGIIVDPENIEELKSAMELMICDPQLRIKMAMEGKSLLSKNGMREAVIGYVNAINMALKIDNKNSPLCY